MPAIAKPYIVYVNIWSKSTMYMYVVRAQAHAREEFVFCT